MSANIRNTYYRLKPAIPRRWQICLRRNVIRATKAKALVNWPIMPSAALQPINWPGWPAGKQFAVVLTHDVESSRGQEQVPSLMELEQDLGFRSTFNFVPERYPIDDDLREHLRANDFEIGVHGLYHDGLLYQSLDVFRQRAGQINRYLKEWQAVGFRSPAMHHNLDWIHLLNIEYDMSTFDTDPFEPQADGVGTIFPFWVQNPRQFSGYVELPYTLPQDFTLFVLMQEKSIRIWKRKLDWIARNGGMVLLNTHPDYMHFSRQTPLFDQFTVRHYTDLLNYIRTRYNGQYWAALPREVAAYIQQHQAENGPVSAPATIEKTDHEFIQPEG